MELSPSAKAWMGIGAGVAAYDILCPKGETLSEGVDKIIERNKFTRCVALGGIALVFRTYCLKNTILSTMHLVGKIKYKNLQKCTLLYK